MIEKGIIKNILSDNKLSIRIPIFESAGSLNKYIVDAPICYQGGNINSYEIGDVVFVDFENNDLNSPIVVGKLFTGKEEKATNFSYSKDLEVVGDTKLSKNTTIGDLTYDDLKSNLTNEKVLQTNINKINNDFCLLGNVYVKKRLSLVPNIKNTDDKTKAFIFVDNNGKDARIALSEIKGNSQQSDPNLIRTCSELPEDLKVGEYVFLEKKNN